MDADFSGEIGQGSPCLVFGYEIIDLDLVQTP